MTASRFELGTDGPRTVVVGVDGSDVSLRAAAYAMGVARRHGSKLIAVKVDSDSSAVAALAATVAPASYSAVYDSQNDTARRLTDQLTADANTWSTHCDIILRRGDPATELAHVADQSRADMVVVGASTTLAHRLAGSLPQRLSRQRRWVLTVVP